MAAWSYAAFEEEASDTARLSMLRQHISEVRMAISANVSADGKSRDSTNLVQYLAGLNDRRVELEQATGQGGRGAAILYTDSR